MKVIVFDGVCNLCNATVDFLLRKDRKGVFQFASNQSEAGRNLLQGEAEAESENGEINTLFLVEDGQVYRRSTAVLRIARGLGFPWNLATAFLIVPRPIRDAVYRWVAHNRYRWFGKKDTCRLPSPAERARFL